MRRGFGCIGLSCALFALAVGAPRSSAAAGSSEAATRAAARDLGSAGVQAFQAGDFATANEKLDAAYRVLKAPSLGLWSARALAKVGKWVEARERYVEVTRLDAASGDEAIQRQAKADAASEGDALAQRIPRLVVQVEGAPAAEVAVTIDGVSLPSALVGQASPVNPGAHHLEGVRGSERVVADVTVTEAQQQTALLRFVQQAAVAGGAPGAVAAPTVSGQPAHKPMQRTLGWVAVGVGGAGLVVGSVTGALVLSKKSSLGCANNLCPVSDKSDVDGYNSMRTVSTVSFVVGGVLAATGVVLVLTAKPTCESVALVLTPASAVLHGSF
jgi:hypothetical protein